jgi:hypothetical protein
VITAFDVDNAVQLNRTTFVYETPVQARYVRLDADDCGIDRYARLCGFEVIGDPPPRTDFDADHDVDLADFGIVQLCYSGPGVPHAGTIGAIDCGLADREHGADDPEQGDVDLLGVAAFVECLAGPGEGVSLECY